MRLTDHEVDWLHDCLVTPMANEHNEHPQARSIV